MERAHLGRAGKAGCAAEGRVRGPPAHGRERPPGAAGQASDAAAVNTPSGSKRARSDTFCCAPTYSGFRMRSAMRSASAAMVREGLIPMGRGMIDPSATYSPS